MESEFAESPNKKSSFLHHMQKYTRVKSKCLLSVISLFFLHMIRQGRCGGVFDGGLRGDMQCYTLHVLQKVIIIQVSHYQILYVPFQVCTSLVCV